MLEEKLKAKVTLLRPESNTSGMASKVIPELVAYIKLSDILSICQEAVDEACKKPISGLNCYNCKYMKTDYYGDDCDVRTDTCSKTDSLMFGKQLKDAYEFYCNKHNELSPSPKEKL